ncbi:MAG: DUF3368 domain-containing protein [Cyclobacteriaceae bacterium]
MFKLVIADTSCLIVLTKIERLDLLQKTFDEITISKVIKDEFGEKLPDWIQVKKITDEKRQQILEMDLDAGEASAMALGLENEESLLLIDERKGRKVARALGLKITGTLGVIINAKEKNFINSIREEIDKLRAIEFRMSENLIQQILDKFEKDN